MRGVGLDYHRIDVRARGVAEYIRNNCGGKDCLLSLRVVRHIGCDIFQWPLDTVNNPDLAIILKRVRELL
jgi:hypothetical protein